MSQATKVIIVLVLMWGGFALIGVFSSWFCAIGVFAMLWSLNIDNSLKK